VGTTLVLVAMLLAAEVDLGERPANEPLTASASVPTVPDIEFRLEPRGEGYFYPDPRFLVRIRPDGGTAFSTRHFRPGYAGFIPKPVPPWVETSRLVGEVMDEVSAVAPVYPVWSDGLWQLEWERAWSGPDNVLCRPDFTCWRLTDVDDLIVFGFGANADLNDFFYRQVGVDPYSPLRAQFLAITFEMRMDMAVAADRANTEARLRELPLALARMWLYSPMPAAARRRLLFELWQETAETPAGATARSEIERFIRTALPCGSRHAYTPAELAAYDRASPERGFAPYLDCGR
jgi:hypothetical protein